MDHVRSSTWVAGIGGVIAGAVGLAVLLRTGEGEWLCPAIGLVLLGCAFLCMLHVIIVDAMQTTAARKLQVHQCQQLAMLIEQNRQIIEAMKQRDSRDGDDSGTDQ